MIFVRFDEARIPQELRDEAERLTRELSALTSDAERRQFIERHSRFWAKVKPFLEQMSKDKCWYSEAKDVASYMQVEHFRPKDGYWWLAFKLANYRLAGAVMNVRKSTAFPLGEGSFQALCPTDDETLENCLLLDPCSEFDPCLITFDEYGNAVPNCQEGCFDHQRARETIKLYHLNHQPLAEMRRDVWRACESLVDQVAAVMARAEKERAYAKAKLGPLVHQLRMMATAEAEMSSVARACLLKSPHPWARQLA